VPDATVEDVVDPVVLDHSQWPRHYTSLDRVASRQGEKRGHSAFSEK
jgi:hypothetical protein